MDAKRHFSEHVAECIKRQRLCENATSNAIDTCTSAVDDGLAQLEGGEAGASVLKAISDRVQAANVVKGVLKATKEYHESIKSLSKVLDEAAAVDMEVAVRQERLPREALLKVILSHLYRKGMFDVGDVLAQEASIEGSEARQIFSDMHRLRPADASQLPGALNWAIVNRSKLSNHGLPTRLEFKLHRLIFLEVLHSDGTGVALKYAREHFPPFQQRFLAEIKRLMGFLLFAGRPSQHSPYSDLQTDPLLADASTDFVREACGLLGQACRSPLTVAVAAGAVALPQLVKLSQVSTMMGSSGSDMDLATCEHMPIELELGPEFTFHSIFACPVSKEMTDDDNPPTLLPCGHVLSLHSVQHIATSASQRFKCPYCPEETESRFCLPLQFPDAL